MAGGVGKGHRWGWKSHSPRSGQCSIACSSLMFYEYGWKIWRGHPPGQKGHAPPSLLSSILSNMAGWSLPNVRELWRCPNGVQPTPRSFSKGWFPSCPCAFISCWSLCWNWKERWSKNSCCGSTQDRTRVFVKGSQAYQHLWLHRSCPYGTPTKCSTQGWDTR